MGSAPSCFSSNIQLIGSSSSRTPSTNNCFRTPVVVSSSDMHNKNEGSISHRHSFSPATSLDIQEGITLPTRLDDDVWSVSTTPDCAAVEDNEARIQSLMKHKKSTSHFEAYIGWEVYVDGLGIGRIIKCITPSENELSFLLLLQDGRKYVVPVSVTVAREDGLPEMKLIRRLE